jgi:hypothetical protein
MCFKLRTATNLDITFVRDDNVGAFKVTIKDIQILVDIHEPF